MPRMLDRKDCILLIIDVQEKLVKALDKDVVVGRTATLAKASKILEIPTIVTQQYSKGLGLTVDAVKQHLAPDTQIFEKSAFSAVKEPGFLELLKSYNRKQVAILGIETHICVHQTASDLLEEGFEVHVIKDACASRSKYEFKQGIERIQQSGAVVSCVEIALFEWLRSAKNPCFKDVQALIK